MIPADAVRVNLDYRAMLSTVDPETRRVAEIIMTFPHTGDIKRPGYPTAIYQELGIRWQKLQSHLLELADLLRAWDYVPAGMRKGKS